MVKFSDPTLDRAFAALADPTRRGLIAQLAEHDILSVSELARPLPMSLPAVLKHLDVLSAAGLITRTKTGRTVRCRLQPGAMAEAVDWLNRYERFWSERLDRLAAYVEEESCPQPNSQPSQASPSSAGSTRRRGGSSMPGPTRKS